MKEIQRLVLVLTLICVVAAAALAAVYGLTKKPIADRLRKVKLDAIESVLPTYDNKPDKELKEINLGKDHRGREKKITFYTARKQGAYVGTALEYTTKGFGGPLTVIVGVTPDGSIHGVNIISHKETPGLGAKVERPDFLDQFKGKSLANSSFKLKKDRGDLDQVTGATISSRAMVEAVKFCLGKYQEHSGD